MKHFILLFSILFSFTLLNAQETYRFRANASQGLSVESSTAAGLSLHYSINEIDIADIDNGEAKGQEIILNGCFGSIAVGLPNLPYENRYIAVPRGAQVDITVNEKASTTIEDVDLLPVAEFQMNAEASVPPMRKDMSVFGKDADFPSENVAIAQSTRIRGLDVVLLSVTPFRYNPVRKTLEVIYDMDIEVHFEGGNGQFGEARYLNPAWYGILRDLVVNADMLPENHYYDLVNHCADRYDIGCEYLIIAPDDDSILAWADTLRRFRSRQGVLTKVVTTTECGGNDPNAIKGYIKNAYDNWVIPPAALMIFSSYQDSLFYEPYTYDEYVVPGRGIPGFPLLFLRYDYENGYIVDFNYISDSPYADMNDDSIPDMAISRLSAITPEQYQLQIEKLINYETHPPLDAHFYDHPVITAGHEANKWFLATSQIVDGFCRNKLGKHPTNLYMMYDPSLPRPDTVWSTGQHTEAVVDYFGPNGQNYIPSDPSGLDHWLNKEYTPLLADAINEETFLTLYRDHSASYFWCCPYFYADDIHNLHNANPTFILSIGCDAACYEENYSTFYATWLERSVLTEFCDSRVGALGGIGAVTVTRSHFNDRISWGVIDYLWPNFMPTLGSSSVPEFARPAYALVAGKLFLTQDAFMANWWPGYITDTHNVFHYIGEAYLNLYTEVPEVLRVDAPLYHANNQWQYEFTAEEGAVVCVSKDDGIMCVVYGTGQNQSITLPEMAVGERFVITATKHNYIRFQQTVEVIPSTMSYVYVRDSEVIDHDGNGQLDFGETADIDLRLHNAGDIASQSATIQLLCDSPYVEILQGNATYPNIEPNAEYTLNDAFQIRLSNDVPDQTRLHFEVRFNEGQNTHCDAMTVEANAPDLYIEPEFSPMTAEGKPSTHIATEGPSKLAFTVTNKGHSGTGMLHANFDIKAPFVEVENAQIQHEGLAPNESYDFTYELNTTPNTITGAWLQSHFNVQHMEHRIWLDTIVQYGGIFENFETDTLNPQLQWSNTGNYRWIYSDIDAYEGDRCFVAQADTTHKSMLLGRLIDHSIKHKVKISFQFKTDDGEDLRFKYYEEVLLSSEEWQYAELTLKNGEGIFNFIYLKNHGSSAQARLDNICFPPKHTTIAYAGNDIITCDEEFVVLYDAYAYDCDSILWTTDGDGRFDRDTIANPFYYPGNQDIENGSVTLTLTAFGDETVVSTTQIHFADDVSLGAIIGDSVVNKYSNPISHYAVENPEGMHHSWYLEPTEAGIIYGFGDAIDILWNQHEGDVEATLWAWADHGCESVSKPISLIGYSVPEWHAVEFELFPNPTDGKVNLVIGETLQGKAVIEVYNLLGERVLVQKASQLRQGETISLDLSRMVSGLYIIKLSTENGSCSKKVSVW